MPGAAPQLDIYGDALPASADISTRAGCVEDARERLGRKRFCVVSTSIGRDGVGSRTSPQSAAPWSRRRSPTAVTAADGQVREPECVTESIMSRARRAGGAGCFQLDAAGQATRRRCRQPQLADIDHGQAVFAGSVLMILPSWSATVRSRYPALSRSPDSSARRPCRRIRHAAAGRRGSGKTVSLRMIDACFARH